MKIMKQISVCTLIAASLMSQQARSGEDDRLCGWVAQGSTETVGVFIKYEKSANLEAWCKKSAIKSLEQRAISIGLPSGASGWQKKANYKCTGINKNFFGKDGLCKRMARTGQNTAQKVHVIKFSGGKIQSVERL